MILGLNSKIYKLENHIRDMSWVVASLSFKQDCREEAGKGVIRPEVFPEESVNRTFNKIRLILQFEGGEEGGVKFSSYDPDSR